jgi:hypothetical protein
MLSGVFLQLPDDVGQGAGRPDSKKRHATDQAARRCLDVLVEDVSSVDAEEVDVCGSLHTSGEVAATSILTTSRQS